MHGVERVATEAWIGRVPPCALQNNRECQNAFMGDNGLQPRGFADDGEVGLWSSVSHQLAGTSHRGLFVRSRQNHQWFVELFAIEKRCCFQGDREEPFHVAAT